MAQATVRMPGYMGMPWEVSGDVESGLILHKIGKSWCISHTATGCRIGEGDKLQKDCKARRARLLALLPDWTADSVEGLAQAAGMDARAFTDAVRKAAY
jgi:hypothetical protein